jgi:hypothetical protein
MTDEPTREEKLRIIMEADRAVNTLAAHQALLEPGLAGRFAKESRHDFTVGKTPTVEYPRLPSNSPWQQEQPPPEEPTGYEINAMDPVGSPEEIERSAQLLFDSVADSPATDAEASPTSALVGPSPLPDRPTATPPSATPASMVASSDLSSSADPSWHLNGSANLAQPQSAADTPKAREGVRRGELSGVGSFPTWRRFG